MEGSPFLLFSPSSLWILQRQFMPTCIRFLCFLCYYIALFLAFLIVVTRKITSYPVLILRRCCSKTFTCVTSFNTQIP